MPTDGSPTLSADASGTQNATRVKAVACLGGISIERGIPTEEFHDYIKDPQNLLWVDVQDPGEQGLAMLLEEFGFHPLSLEDLAKGEQRSKVDEFKGYLLVVAYSALPSESIRDVRTAEVDLFVGRNYLVTVHRGPVPSLEDAYSRWTRGGQMLSEGVGFLVYTVIDAIMDSYFPIFDAIEDSMDSLELAMLGRADSEMMQELLSLKRTLGSLRRVLVPLREVFNVFLRRDRPVISTNTSVYFQHVYDRVLRLIDTLELERERVSGALEAYLTVLSNRLNVTMRALTVFTVILASLSAVFGAWGMNFEHVPWSRHEYGFEIISGLSLLFLGMVLLFAWKRGWL